MLLSDSSDVEDEASSYFCIDDDPKYRKFCNTPPGSVPEPAIKRDFFIDHFASPTASASPSSDGSRRGSATSGTPSNDDHNRIGWTTANPDPAKYRPLGVEGGIARSLENMTKLSDLLASRNIPLTIVVYPWAQQIAQNDRDSKQVRLWRDFCPDTLQGLHRPVPGLLRGRRSPTRTGTSISISSATTTSPQKAIGCCSRS